MASYRYPILIWRDLAGGYTCVVVDEENLAGFGPTIKKAREELKDFLEWRVQHEFPPLPDFQEPQLHRFSLKIRPEYRTPERIYPCENHVVLRVHCVTGKQRSGLLVASLPLLGIRFSFPEAEGLKPLVQRYVQQMLEGLSPAQLARFLEPPEVTLDDVVVRAPRSKSHDDSQKPPEVLLQVAEPLGDKAMRRQFSRAWHRDDEVALLERKLHRERASVLLIGEPGVGKTAVLMDAVHRIEKEIAGDERRESKIARRYWSTSAGRIIAGMKYLGQWEERCEELIAALGEIRGVLCVDRLLDLVQTGGKEATDSIAAFLVPFLQRGELRLVGEATAREFDACRRLLPGFSEVFQTIPIAPFDRSRSLAVLDKTTEMLKPNLRVEVEPGVTDRVVHLYRRFAPYEVFPGKAVAFLRELLERASRNRDAKVTPETVVEQFMNRTGLPERFLRDELPLTRDEVSPFFRESVIDQDEATEAATNLVMTFKAGLNDPNRPLGVMLFCGPTGVGKTEMAQTLARYFFGHAAGDSAVKDRLIRLDMSEYSSFDAVELLVGSAGGQPSELVRRVRQQPFCVLLLDEIEKASDEVFDLFLGVFDEGRLSDRFGRITNFRSCVIVMTSNLGADKQSLYGFGTHASTSRNAYRDVVREFFRPEFFNRLDSVVTFHPLSRATIRKIVLKELANVLKREGFERGARRIEWSESLVDHLAKIGFDPRYGARPLQRTIEREVVAPLAKWLLQSSPQGDGVLVAELTEQGAVQFR